MSDKLPSLKAKEIAKILEKLGFEFKENPEERLHEIQP